MQLQFVPRGTESPNATIDHDRDDAVVVVAGDVVEDAAVEEVVAEGVADFPAEFPHAVARQQSAARPATAKPSHRISTS
jgi:hypothetical protein